MNSPKTSHFWKYSIEKTTFRNPENISGFQKIVLGTVFSQCTYKVTFNLLSMTTWPVELDHRIPEYDNLTLEYDD